MKRSTLVPLALLCCGALALGACGSDESPSDSSGPTTITVMTWESAETNAAIDKALASFANPGIKVSRIDAPSGNYGDQLASLTQAKKLPDLFWCGNDTEQQYTSQGLLVDWSKRLAEGPADFNESAFVPVSVQNWKTADGKMGGLPSLMNTYGVWYNADAFKAAGLAEPKAGWTWDDMFTAAKTLANKNGAKYGLLADGLTEKDGPFAMSAYAVSAGGAPFTDSVNQPTKVTIDPKYAEGVAKLADGVKSGAIAPPGYDASSAQSLFAGGKVPMVWGGQWLAAGFLTDKPSIDYGFAPMPQVDTPTTVYDAVGICTPSYTKNQDAAYEVLRYLNTTVMGEVLKTSPVAAPAYIKGQETYFSALNAGKLTSVVDAVKTGLQTEQTVGVRFTTAYSGQVNDVVTANWPGILKGEKPVSELSTMADQINKIITSNS